MHCIKSSAALFTLALLAIASDSSLQAANTTGMPKAAPDFRAKFTTPKKEKSSEADYSGTSFRVQTRLPALQPATPIPAATTIQGTVKHNDAGLLMGSLDSSIIKTSPQRPQSASVPPEVFRGWLEQAHPQFALRTSTLQPHQVLEVKGVYDNSGKTLNSLGIPFQKVRGADLATMPLNETKVIVVDCPGRVPRQSFQQVRDWVAAGGFLLSTDWSSDNLIETCFPGYIKWDRHSNDQAVYDAEIVNPDPSLYTRTVTNASWKMDIDSHMIATLRPDVRVLARSKQLQAEDPAGAGVLAVIFPFGRGYVLHLVGHFDNNTMMPFRHMLADPAPQIGISLRQAIAANFVVAGLQGRKIPIKK